MLSKFFDFLAQFAFIIGTHVKINFYKCKVGILFLFFIFLATIHVPIMLPNLSKKTKKMGGKAAEDRKKESQIQEI